MPSLPGWMLPQPLRRENYSQGSDVPGWLPLCPMSTPGPSLHLEHLSFLPSHSEGSLLPLSALSYTLDTRMLLEAFLSQVQGLHESLGFLLYLGAQYRTHHIYPLPAL